MPPQKRRKRQRSIRVLLASIFIIPLASLLGLWGFAATITVSNAIQEHNFTSQDQSYGSWAQTLFTQLAQERLIAYEWLSGGHRGSDAAYLTQQKQTNMAVTMLLDGLTSRPPGSPAARPALVSFKAQVAALGGIRGAVQAGAISAIKSFDDYNQIVEAEFNLYADLVVVNNTPLYLQAAASVEAGRAIEMASREVTLATGAIMDGSQMSKAERVLFAQTAANRQYLMADALRELSPALGSGYRRADASSAYQSFTALEAGISDSVGSRGPVPGALAFGLAAAQLFKYYQTAEVQDRLALSSLGTQVGNHLLLEVGLAGGIGLIAVVLSIFLMVRFGRRISRELTGLQFAALDLAEQRLPRVMARLSQGEEVNVAAEAAPPPAGRIRETARVAEAFSSVQRTAVEAAVGQARLRAGVAQVFRNLAWRSQSLLHRQLTLLDAMERRSSEPETLDELFQLDHLTTRMRRHAEGLIILSGAAPGRGWREPVPIMDVLRGAIAEVEDYKRVTVISESQDAVVGSAVADVIHLLAELIENATTYSPASTEVTIRAERVANGFAVEIEDRGIGIGADETAAFNERLANPPEFDIADSNQLGLFVVARLAGKHHIRITLRTSPYGGTAAIVLLPHPIVVVSDSVGTFAVGMRPAGNGREHAGNGRELTGIGREPAGNGRELPAGSGPEPAGNGREPAGNGREITAAGPVVAGDVPDLTGTGRGVAGNVPELTGTGRGVAGNGGEPAGEGGELAGTGRDMAGHSHDPVGSGRHLAGTGPDLAGNGWRPAGNGRDVVGSGQEATGAAVEPQLADPSPRSFDVFRTEPPATVGPRDDAARPSPAVAPPAGRLAPYGPADEKTPWSDSPVWETGKAPDSPRPWLPRRIRQASLAPQLKTDSPAAADDIRLTTDEADDTNAGIGDGPSPADTRALVQSLQVGLERAARTSEEPADESWPAPIDGSWPSPAGNPDLAPWPDDPEGS